MKPVVAPLASLALLASLGPAHAQELHETLPRTRLAGRVLRADGDPAQGALVVSSAGGKALTDPEGCFELWVEPPSEATEVQLTAVEAGRASSVVSRTVALVPSAGSQPIGVLCLTSTSCAPEWLPTFGPDASLGMVTALAVFDDGGGPDLYVAGQFTLAGGQPANHVARWDGAHWSDLGAAMYGAAANVLALTVFDDGSGPALYAGGYFLGAGGSSAHHVARWDGASWSALGSGTNDSVYALAGFDDGSGPALYAAGAFTTAGGVSANRIARWDGASWTALGSGMSASVSALAVYDDGAGPTLFAGGSFTQAGGLAASHIARWRAGSWAGLRAGTDGPVAALTVFDAGTGPVLCVGGSFESVDGQSALRVATWNGASWAPFGGALSGPVATLFVHDDGSGPALYAGGNLTGRGGLARWTGSIWASLAGSTDGNVAALATFDDGSGPALYAGGSFGLAGDVAAACLARYDGSRWSALEAGLDRPVHALAVFDPPGPDAPALYAGGDFLVAGAQRMRGVARWQAGAWSALDDGLRRSGVSYGTAHALTSFESASGIVLAVGGSFVDATAAHANHVATWDGTQWGRLATGISSYATPTVEALLQLQEAGTTQLLAGVTGPTVNTTNLALWDGIAWSSLGGSGFWAPSDPGVYALALFDDGHGPALYAGGACVMVGPVFASNVARWDGTSWTALGSGTDRRVDALAVFDDGSGPALYAGGTFTSAGGLPANRIARWDGTSWSALGSGLSGGPIPSVNALVVFDDGSGAGPALYAAGTFTSAGGVAASNVAKWNGTSWAPLAGGVSARVDALEVFDDGRGAGPALYVGGAFLQSPAGDSFLARWQGCPDAEAPVIDCPEVVFALDPPSSPPGELVSFTVTVDDRDPHATLVCVPPSGSFFPRGTTLVTCTATDGSGNQSSRQFPVNVWPKARPR